MNKRMDELFAQFREEFAEPEPEESGCQHCFMEDCGIFVCNLCFCIDKGLTDPYIEYKDRPQPATQYEKLTHFKEKIDELTGANTVLIPDEIMQLCKDANGQEEIKTILQVHKQKKYYPCVYLIMRQKGIFIPQLFQHEKERLVRLFKQIEEIYNKIKRKTNMISYHYLLSKMLPMIGRPDLVPFLFILHSKRKLKEYDLMWRKVVSLL